MAWYRNMRDLSNHANMDYLVDIVERMLEELRTGAIHPIREGELQKKN
jgi:hypothetical protein